MKTLIIVQARTGSTRFPKKILQLVEGEPILLKQLERISRVTTAVNIVVATSIRSDDDIIEKICVDKGYDVFRGDLNNLLDRHYKAAIKYNADHVVKIPSDCPLIDPYVIDRVLNYYFMNSDKYDYVSNLHPATYPDGNDVEVMSMNALAQAWHQAEKDYELEHTTPYIWDNPDKFSIGNVVWETNLDYSKSHRWTLDYPEDFEFIKNVYTELYKENSDFSMYDILNLLSSKPEIASINAKYLGEFWYNKYLNILKHVDNSGKEKMFSNSFISL